MKTCFALGHAKNFRRIFLKRNTRYNKDLMKQDTYHNGRDASRKLIGDVTLRDEKAFGEEKQIVLEITDNVIEWSQNTLPSSCICCPL